MAVITPLAGKLALWKISTTVYQFTSWTLPFKLDHGEVMHFDGQTDSPGNYWPTVFSNWARAGEGTVDGFVNHGSNIIPVSWTNSVYIGVTGTFACLWSATDGFTFPGLITGNNMSADAAATDPGKLGLTYVMTGPPTRVFS